MLFRGKKKYQFNPETLSYEYRRVTLRQRLARVSVELVCCTVGGTGLMLALLFFVDTPGAERLEAERQHLLGEAVVLTTRVENATERIARLESHDNNLYRTIFEADSIPNSVRMGGVGGVDHYPTIRFFNQSETLRDLSRNLDQLRWRAYIQSKSFDQVASMAYEKDQLMRCIPAVQPVSVRELARISSLFGYRRDPFTGETRLHAGVDFVGAQGTPIHCTGDGLVITADRSGTGYGNQVVVDHGFGYKTRYAHLKRIDVKEGERVKRGQVVGTMGSTGRSTSVHLHYEVLVKNRPVNPLLYFNDMGEEEYEQMLANAQIQHLD